MGLVGGRSLLIGEARFSRSKSQAAAGASYHGGDAVAAPGNCSPGFKTSHNAPFRVEMWTRQAQSWERDCSRHANFVYSEGGRVGADEFRFHSDRYQIAELRQVT